MRIVLLDILRFLAALYVLIYHYVIEFGSTWGLLHSIAKFGYLGVPLFFILSGFVISASADRRSPVRFLVSRAARLYPAYIFGVIFTSVIIFSVSGETTSAYKIVSNLSFLNEYIGVSNVDGVYWTLHVEIKFYGCIFLLLIFGIYNNYKVWLTVWLIVSITHRIFEQPFFMGWFISPSYSPYFICGVAYYLIYKEGVTFYSSLILFCSMLLSFDRSLVQVQDFVPGAGLIDGYTAVFIILVVNVTFLTISLRKLSIKNRRIYSILGGITYPLYLIHNEAGKALIYDLSSVYGESLSILVVGIFMVFVSFLVYSFVEPTGSKYVRLVLNAFFDWSGSMYFRFFGGYKNNRRKEDL